MKATDLLGADVTDADGVDIGRVHDVRLRRDDAGDWRISQLVVGRGAMLERWGYDHGSTRGPWILERLARAVARTSHLVDWSQVESVEPGRFTLSARAADLPHPRTGDRS